MLRNLVLNKMPLRNPNIVNSFWHYVNFASISASSNKSNFHFVTQISITYYVYHKAFVLYNFNLWLSSFRQIRNNTDSSSDFSDEDSSTVPSFISTPSASDVTVSATPSLEESTSRVPTPNSESGNMYASSFNHIMLKKLEQLVATQDQQSIVLNNILRLQQSQSIQHLERPLTMPDLPVNNKMGYKSVEEFLTNTDNFQYMVWV